MAFLFSNVSRLDTKQSPPPEMLLVGGGTLATEFRSLISILFHKHPNQILAERLTGIFASAYQFTNLCPVHGATPVDTIWIQPCQK